jgi:hypothetical protein
MRSVALTVGGTVIGEGKTWAYPNGDALGEFLIPIYKLTVAGTDNIGKRITETISVFRFGVQCKDGKTAEVVGLADHQTHVIKSWIPTYRVHSAISQEDGAWQVYGNFLIHDGPDDDTELFATIGCVEIMGPQGFLKFNDLLISLMDPPGTNRDQKLSAIGRSGQLSITYERATRPALKKAL